MESSVKRAERNRRECIEAFTHKHLEFKKGKISVDQQVHGETLIHIGVYTDTCHDASIRIHCDNSVHTVVYNLELDGGKMEDDIHQNFYVSVDQFLEAMR